MSTTIILNGQLMTLYFEIVDPVPEFDEIAADNFWELL